MPDNLTRLRVRLGELSDLRTTAQLLHWDQQTMMPPRGATLRAESLATIERISHDMFVADETGELLEAAAGELDGAGEDSDDVCLVRLTRRRWEKARRVPTRPGGRACASRIGGAGGVGRGARELRLRVIRPEAQAQHRAGAHVCLLL